jgi:hypothetical protein
LPPFGRGHRQKPLRSSIRLAFLAVMYAMCAWLYRHRVFLKA